MHFVKCFCLGLFFLFAVGCEKAAVDSSQVPTSEKKVLIVSAAVSLKDAVSEIGEKYRSKTGNEIIFNFGASGALQRQIENGAPADVFASAGQKQMDDLLEKGLIELGSRIDFARNSLVLIVPQDSDLKIAGFNDLAGDAVKKIAVGNPKTVPAGQYTEQVFINTGIAPMVANKLVFAEDVRHVLDYVTRGEVDAGVVYGTDARMAGEKVRVTATAEEGSHLPVLYPIAVLRDSRNKSASNDFIKFVTGPEGQAILQNYGFGRTSQ